MMLYEEDRGHGDLKRWPLDELERMYRADEPGERIMGNVLNALLRVNRYEPESWYLVTDEGVRKL